MKRLLRSLVSAPQLKKLNLCQLHLRTDGKGNKMVPLDQPVPYSMDHCISCQKHICYSCSEEHVVNHCEIELGIVKQLGQGVLKNFNLGEVIKVDLRNMKCICGKPLTKGAAICAACGLASCSESCHRQWEKMGNCKFSQNFYNLPEGFNFRSIVFGNIETIQKSNADGWVIANKTGTNMICCYANSQHPFVYFQRGYRNYGSPNQQFLARMQPMQKGLDYYIHFERRCNCNCQICKNMRPHSSTNCQASCINFDLSVMSQQNRQSKNHKQCTCSCKFCMSGVIFNTHRFIDCMPFCERSDLANRIKTNIY